LRDLAIALIEYAGAIAFCGYTPIIEQEINFEFQKKAFARRTFGSRTVAAAQNP
jgi:hypothetical protein